MNARKTLDQMTSDDLDQLHDALARVRALHQPTGILAAAEHGNPPDCTTCGHNRWPCPTITALDETAPAATPATEVVASVHGARDLSPAAEEALGALIDVAKRQITEEQP